MATQGLLAQHFSPSHPIMKSPPLRDDFESKTDKFGDKFSLALFFWLGSWYCCSLVTLFMNKIILTSEGGDKYMLGITQMVMTACLGAVKVYGPTSIAAVGKRTIESGNPSAARYTTFWRDMILVGIMRGATVICGLVSLSHVAVSFTETIKSSAPFFTVSDLLHGTTHLKHILICFIRSSLPKSSSARRHRGR